MNQPFLGLRWRKLDLHVHTPASRDYTGPSITPAEFVEAARGKGLDGIAITDHNTAAWIDDVMSAAGDTPLAVFPGVEVSATGGTGGIHILAVFDRSETSKTIESLLAKLGIEPRQQGRTDAITSCSPQQVIELIAQMGGLAVLAHADSSKGVLADMKGEGRTRVVRCDSLSAAELCNYEKSAKFLDGSDPTYRRRLASYRASDNPNPDGSGGHSAEGMASRYTWFKTDGLTLNALNQCFADPSVRIVPDTVSPAKPIQMYPRIVSVSASQGFLKGAAFEFHEGLNSIIGGKGVGKSLLVEAMRFALDQPSPIGSIRADMLSKLKAQLGIGGIIRVEAQLEHERIVVVERTFDGGENPIRLSLETSEPLDAHVSQLLPVLAYSQTEALEIAKDEKAQLHLIDTLLDIAPLLGRIRDLRAQLAGADKDFCIALHAVDSRSEKEKDLKTISERIAQIDRALKSAMHDEIRNLEPKTQYLDALLEHVDSLSSCLENTADELNDIDSPALDKSLADDSKLKALRASAQAARKNAVRASAKLQRETDQLRAAVETTRTSWAEHVAKREAEYRIWAGQQGGDQAKLTAERKRLLSDRERATKTVKAIRSKADGFANAKKVRNVLLQDLRLLKEELFQRREARYAEIQAASDAKLELSIVQGGDRTGYVQELLALKKGTNLQESTIHTVADNIEPSEFVAYVLAQNAAGLAKHANITAAQAEKLVTSFRMLEAFEEVLALEHAELCVDKPTIRYRKEDGKYYSLDSISIGQKCTALLIVALSDGARPVIIDQPEDALDTPSVFADVTKQLRAKKEQRQFILTTHNSTVAVAGDTDRFQVLTSTADLVTLAASGAMDRPTVTAHVIQHLEGGEEPFEMKATKYARQRSRPGSAKNSQ